MKIDRLLAILTLLLQRKQMTAPQLAERFEVSRRTISRDIDTLCQAGIPIVTRQGGGGGISIAEGYKLDRSVLTREDLQNIVIGLRSLGSVDSTGKLDSLLQKLVPDKAGDVLPVQDGVIIDLSSHYRESRSRKIGLLRGAIRNRHLVRFDYYSARNKERRLVEPCYVVFKWMDWYVFGYCRTRRDYRLFKLGRLWNLEDTGEVHKPREVPGDKLDLDAFFTDERTVQLIFSPRAEYLVVEAYGPDSYTRGEDGRLHFSRGYTDRAHIVRWILSFGGMVEVAGPQDLRDEVSTELRRACERYERPMDICR